MSKKRCKLSPQEYVEKVCDSATHVCKKCNRVAKNNKRLCDAKKIKK